jgi:GNAT superfamily N-acetyltransferase
MARGETAFLGSLTGDSVVAPEWQRKGIASLLADASRSLVLRGTGMGLSWPNEKSRQRGFKRGRSEQILGPLPRATVVLSGRRYLAGHERSMTDAIGGIVAGTALAACRKLLVRGTKRATLQTVGRFDGGFDAVTVREAAWPGFWMPHCAEFLNWRYLDHPLGRYVALALVEDERPTGYAVVRVAAEDAWLMEFVAPPSWRRAGALLLRVLAVAREAGCSRLRFSTAARWPHWRLLYAAGFVPTASQLFLWVGGKDTECRRLDNWRWVPGDMDHL